MTDPVWVALSLTKHMGGRTFRALAAHFNGDLHAVLNATSEELQRVPGIGPTIAQSITCIDPDAVHRALTRWQQAGITVLTRTDPSYPPPLRRLADAPPTLFALGMLPDFRRAGAYAIVGTRSPVHDSVDIATQLASRLAERGRIVVSGLAAGIDTAAHMGALAVPGGLTVAVLGSGILNPYPPQNHQLARAIAERGALLCEVSPDAAVSTPGLVARNRIITGLCDGVIIVETGIGGGAMHAARFARAQDVPIYTLETSATGNQALLRDGAMAITPDLHGLP